ncbi:diacylglycerol/lipid kinase family protein [Alkalicoccobacillus porphyridii]|nr:diacylglycerol kinase family protein [Alkalicoccobacillus porphyridii]
MYKKALLIYNIKAGQEEIQDQLGLIASELVPLAHTFMFIQTLEKGEAETLCESHGSEIDLLLIVGGDGTVHECINGLMKLPEDNRPTVAILPAGTCNDFSRSLQIRTIEEAIAAIKVGAHQRLDIGEANQRYFTNFIGLGLITEASQAKEGELKDKWGKIGYMVSALQSLKNPNLFTYNLKTDSETFEGEAVMVLAMNGHYLGTTGLFVENNQMNDGLIDIYILKEAGFSLLKNVYNKSRSNTEKEWLREAEDVQVIRTSSFQLETNDQQLADSDGELYLEAPLTVSMHEKALDFIYAEETNNT